MKTARLTFLVAMGLLLWASLALAKPNFSGEWKMNAGKSDFGMMPAPTSLEQKIIHSDPDLKVARIQKGEMGEFKSESTYTTDGKECLNKTQMGEQKSKLKWEGDALVIESQMEIQGNAVTITNRWTLSEDGKVLTINTHLVGPQGENDAKIVLDKQ